MLREFQVPPCFVVLPSAWGRFGPIADYERGTDVTSFERIAPANSGAASAFFLCAGLLASFAAVAPSLRAAPGSMTGSVLALSLSPRAAGMGEAFTAVDGGLDSLSINPAGLPGIKANEFNAMHAGLPAGMSQEEISYGISTRWGSFAGQFMSFGSGSVDSYDASDHPLGTVSTQDQLFRVGYARTIIGGLTAGVGAARLQENLAGAKDATVFADLGLKAQLPDPRLSLALAYRNLGKGLKFDSSSSPLPQTLAIGAAWDQKISPILGVLVAADELKPIRRSWELHAGAELRVYDVVYVRLGYLTEQDIGSGLGFGAGVRWRGFGVDYARESLGDLGDTQRVSVSYRFGGEDAVISEQAAAGGKQ